MALPARSWYVPYLIFLGLTLPWVRALPIWDGMYYFSCVLRATQPPFPFADFSCADHPPGYLFLAGWPQYFLHGSAVALNLADIAWMCLSIGGVWRLLQTLVGDSVSRAEKALVVSLFASAPLVVAVTYHFSTDLGLLVFYPWVIDGMLRRNLVQTLLAGTGLVFSKETGVGLYAIVWLVGVAPSARRILAGDRRLEELARGGALLVPLLLFGFYLLARQHGGLAWFNDEGAFETGLGPATLTGYAIILLLNFNWALWGFPLLAYIVGWLRSADRRLLSLDGKQIQVGFILLISTLALTRKVPYENPRYFVTSYLPLLLFSYSLLRKARVDARLRLAYLGLLLALNVGSNYFSFDPISVARFGVARYGGMQMYCHYGSAERSCWGQDQMVYNQQFLELQAAQNVLFRELRPTSDTTFVVSPFATAFMHSPLDADSFEKTERGGNTVTPRFVSVDVVAKEEPKPATLYVLDYPRLGAAGRRRLEPNYHVVSEASYGTSRLKIRVTTMSRN